jgi:small subunit ribosomal protein S17
MEKQRGRRKVRIGAVISDKMDKTRVVAVPWSQRHRVYKRAIRRLSKFKVHDEENTTRMGDQVRIIETRPLSKDKRWRIVEILVRGEQVDVAPEEIDATLVEEMEQLPKTAAATVVAEAVVEEPDEPPVMEEAPAEADEPADEQEAEAPVAEEASAEGADEPADEPAAEAPVAEEAAAEEAEEPADEPEAEAPVAEEAALPRKPTSLLTSRRLRPR